MINESIEEVLDYLAGETYSTANDYDKHHFFYTPSKEHKKLFLHRIEWDETKVVEWKKKS